MCLRRRPPVDRFEPRYPPRRALVGDELLDTGQVGGQADDIERGSSDEGPLLRIGRKREPLGINDEGDMVVGLHGEVAERSAARATFWFTVQEAPYRAVSVPITPPRSGVARRLVEVLREDAADLRHRQRVVMHLRVGRGHTDLAQRPRRVRAGHRHDAVITAARERGVPVAHDRVRRHPAGRPQPFERQERRGRRSQEVDGRRHPFNATACRRIAAISGGSRTASEAKRPMPSDASTDPRWGVAMNTTRFTNGSGSKNVSF